MTKKIFILLTLIASLLLVSCSNNDVTEETNDEVIDTYYDSAKDFVKDGNYEAAISLLEKGIKETDSEKLEKYLKKIKDEAFEDNSYEDNSDKESNVEASLKYELYNGQYILDTVPTALYRVGYSSFDDMLGDMELVYSDSSRKLYYQKATGMVAVADSETNSVFLTSDWAEYDDDIIIEEPCEQIRLKYETENLASQISTDTLAEFGKIDMTPIEGGIEVKYEISEFFNKKYTCIPFLIEKSRFEELILKPLSEAAEGDYSAKRMYEKFLSYYVLKDPDSPALSEAEKNAMYQQFPATRTIGAMYKLESSVTEVERELYLFSNAISQYTNYTYEDALYDHQKCGFQTSSIAPPIFYVTLKYVLTNDGVDIKISEFTSEKGTYEVLKSDAELLPNASVYNTEKGECDFERTDDGIKVTFTKSIVESESGAQATIQGNYAGIMSHDEFMAAEFDAEVTIETYVQAHQSWWQDKVTVYCQGSDGAYFLYELACSEEDAAKLVPGTKIRVTGYKAYWSGEIEIIDGTFEFVEGGDTYIAEALDATALLGTDELEAHMNELVSFKGMTLEAVEYKNGEPGDDIFVTLSKDGAEYSFCVEAYLTGPETEVYKAFTELEAGDVVDVECFLYWYNGANPHIIKIS